MRARVVVAPLVAMLLVVAGGAAGASPVDVRYICFDRVGDLSEPDSRGVIRGTNGNDVIVTSAAEVLVVGRGGADRICAFGRAAYVLGGAGHDLVSTGRGDDRAEGGSGRDVLIGFAGDDRLVGGSGSDTVVGGAGDDWVEGGDGANDYLFGGRGSDRLLGGDGADDDDFLVGGEDVDVLQGGGGSDTVSYAFSDVPVHVDLAAGTSSQDLLLAVENIDGSVFEDVLVGDETNNRLHGGDGNDVITGNGGLDHMDGGNGEDSLDGGEGPDFLSFLYSPRAVHADLEMGSATGEAADTFTALEHLSGSAYDDELWGNAAGNQILGSRGVDVLFGRDGDDRLNSGGSGDAGAGEDICWDSPQIQNCEQFLHADPAAYSTITSPTQAASIPISELREVTGTASAGAFGPEPRRVQIALRRLSGSGCYWWHAKRAFMQAGHCERPRWVETDFDDGQGTWSRRVPDPVQLLKAGTYQLRSRIRQRGYTERAADVPHNRIEFRLR